MGALDVVRNRLAKPKKSFYTLWNLPATRAKDHYGKRNEVDRTVSVDSQSGSHKYVIRVLTKDDLPLFDEVRPEATAVPRNYLAEGQIWIGALDEEGKLAAYSFLVLNEGERALLSKNYFWVQPKEAYLHSAWTHPDHRRRGLHILLTEARIKRALQSNQIDNIVTHVAIGLLSSEQAFRGMNFDPTHSLTVSRSGGRGKVTNQRRPIARAPHEDDSGLLRVMVLDGDTPAALSAMQEVAGRFASQIIVGSNSHESAGSKSKHAWQNVVLPRSDSPGYDDRLKQAILALNPDVVVATGTESAKAAIRLRDHGDPHTVFIAPTSLKKMDELAALVPGNDQEAEPQTKVEDAGVTYAGYFVDGEPLAQLQFARQAGTPTLFVTTENARIAEMGRSLLQSVPWSGFAALTFVEGPDGELRLSGATPSVWDSYALAPAAGVPVISTAIEDALGLRPIDAVPPSYEEARMIAPLQEMREAFAAKDVARIPKMVKALFAPNTVVVRKR